MLSLDISISKPSELSLNSQSLLKTKILPNKIHQKNLMKIDCMNLTNQFEMDLIQNKNDCIVNPPNINIVIKTFVDYNFLTLDIQENSFPNS